MATSVYVPFRPVSPIKTFKFATFGCSDALLLWRLNRYSCRVLFGINCTALDQSELSNFLECIIHTETIIFREGTGASSKMVDHTHESSAFFCYFSLFIRLQEVIYCEGNYKSDQRSRKTGKTLMSQCYVQ